MSGPLFKNYNKINDYLLKFEVHNCNSSIVNALRRLIITDVKTYGFNTDDYNNSDLLIEKNSSSLHNEFILHRLGLIPIHFDFDTFDHTKYKFSLDVQNKTDEIIDVTTKDFVVTNLETNEVEDTEKFFPKNSITNDYILIVRLKPTNDKQGEVLKLSGKCSKGYGRQHIRFSPVCKSIFVNKRDPDKVTAELKKYLQDKGELDDEKLMSLKRKFELEEADKHFYTDKNGDPNVFEFTIESIGILKSYKILSESINVIINKLKKFLKNLEKTFNTQDSSIEIVESTSVMKAFDIVIDNENHTLGFLLQYYINKFYEKDDIFVGYMNPHPLQKNIKLRIKQNDGDISKIQSVLSDTSEQIIKIFSELKKEVMREFEGVQPFKVKKSKGKGKSKE